MEGTQSQAHSMGYEARGLNAVISEVSEIQRMRLIGSGRDVRSGKWDGRI
jgi:hypothetical protein